MNEITTSPDGLTAIRWPLANSSAGLRNLFVQVPPGERMPTAIRANGSPGGSTLGGEYAVTISLPSAAIQKSPDAVPSMPETPRNEPSGPFGTGFHFVWPGSLTLPTTALLTGPEPGTSHVTRSVPSGATAGTGLTRPTVPGIRVGGLHGAGARAEAPDATRVEVPTIAATTKGRVPRGGGL